MAMTSQVAGSKPQSTTEIALDIIAFTSICIKCGFEDSVFNQRLLVEMINEAGFRTARGEEFTYMGYRQMMARLDPELKRKIVSECTESRLTETYVGPAEIETYEDTE